MSPWHWRLDFNTYTCYYKESYRGYQCNPLSEGLNLIDPVMHTLEKERGSLI